LGSIQLRHELRHELRALVVEAHQLRHELRALVVEALIVEVEGFLREKDGVSSVGS
jgi:hypothetical protein